jgi:hypothetical protein
MFLAHEVNGTVTVAPAGNAETGCVSDLRDFPGGEVLIAADKGSFLAREVNGKVIVAPADNADTGEVLALFDFPGGGVLIAAEKGSFLAREVNGRVTVAPAGNGDTGRVWQGRDFPAGVGQASRGSRMAASPTAGRSDGSMNDRPNRQPRLGDRVTQRRAQLARATGQDLGPPDHPVEEIGG